MRVTRYTDYALRVLMFLGLSDARRCTIREIAEAYDVSRNHLMKVVQELVAKGYVESVRGVGGGLRLARSPESIRIGQVLVDMEPDLDLVECMRADGQCVIGPACGLRALLLRARASFIDTLDSSSLADLLGPPRAERLSQLLAQGKPAASDEAAV